MRARTSSWIAVVAVGAFALAPIQPATAALDEWDDPITVASTRPLSESAQVVADGSTLVAIWQIGADFNTEVVSSSSTDGVNWSNLRFLSAAGWQADETQLVSAGGMITAAWLQEDDDRFRVQAATSSNGGATWSAAATLSPAGESASDLHLATDGDTVVATWASQAGPDRRIRVATSSNGIAWSTAAQLDIGDDARTPNAIIDGSTAVVAWASFDGDAFTVEMSVSTTTGAVWGAPITLPGTGGIQPKLVYDGDQLTVVFPTFEGPLIMRATPDLGVTWPLVTGVSSGIDGQTYQVDVAAAGDNITAIWWVIGDTTENVQVASTFDGGESWTPVQQLSTARGFSSIPQVIADGDRRVAAWTQLDGAHRRALVATSADGGVTWSAPTTLSVEGGNATAARPVLRGPTTSVLWGFTVGSEAAVQVTSFTDELSVSRLAGPDRYATAAEISGEFASGVPVVYLSTGTNYPDALSAAAAAAAQGGPLLLTTPNSLPGVIADELERLDPALVVVVGGTGVVSNRVVNAVRAVVPDATVRRDSGVNRYATSRVIADRAFATAATAFVATGANFPDALSASAAGGALDAPVILVDGASSRLDGATLDLLDDLGVTSVTIVGGTGAVSRGIEDDLDDVFGASNVQRRSGADRFTTSVAINAATFDDADTVYLATGLGFADALAGAALAGGEPGPLFVVPRTCVPQAVLSEIVDLGARSVVLFGGTAVLTSRVAALQRC